MLHHDPDLMRLARRPTRIATATRAELAAARFPGGGRLLFLEEFGRAFSACSWIFDIKPETAVLTLEAVAAWASREGSIDALVRKTRFVVWSRAHERHLQRVLPGATCFARESECWRAGLSLMAGVPALGGIRAGRTYALPPRLGSFELFTADNIGAVHARGARVLAFLPETDADARQAMALGVDEILTNGRILAD